MLKTRFGNTPYTLIFLQADQAADRGLNAKRTSSGGSHAVLRAQPFSPPCLFVIFVLLLHEAKLTKKIPSSVLVWWVCRALLPASGS